MLEDPKAIIERYHQYMSLYQGEVERQSMFKDYVAHTAFDDLYNRKNFEGHITASVIIIAHDAPQMLLLHHKSLDRWLQPGGHVDYTDDSVLAAALREAHEETGIGHGELELVSPGFSEQIPIDLDSHYIPANPAKSEDQHYHHDVRFLFRYKGSRDIAINQSESRNYRWVGFEELSLDRTFAMLVEKIGQLNLYK